MNGFFNIMKKLSEDVDIFKKSKSRIQNLKIFKISKISKIMFLVFLDGFAKKKIWHFFSTDFFFWLNFRSKFLIDFAEGR